MVSISNRPVRNPPFVLERRNPTFHDGPEGLDRVIDVIVHALRFVVRKVKNRVNALAASKLSAAKRATFQRAEQLVQFAHGDTTNTTTGWDIGHALFSQYVRCSGTPTFTRVESRIVPGTRAVRVKREPSLELMY